MRALVTGASGFVGSWLVRALLERGATVHGTTLGAEGDALPADVHWHGGDIRASGFLAEALAAARPDAVFHLAGVSSVGGAAADPVAAAESNTTAAVRLLTEVARHRAAGTLDPVVLVVGSAEQYGAHPASAQPLGEDTPQRPLSLYAATKAAQEVFALQAFRRDGVRVVAARSFNHTGPGQGERFLVPALVHRALELRRTGGGVLRLGNTAPVRDMAHVCDVVRAYILLAQRGVAGEAYNVCSGTGYSVREIAELVLRRVGVEAHLEEDPALVRPVEVPVLIGDPGRLQQQTGWRAERTLKDGIDDLIHAATQ